MVTRRGAREAQHHRRGIHPDHLCAPPGRGSRRITRATTDVDDAVGVGYRGQVNGEACVIPPHAQDGEGGHQAEHATKARVVGVMVDR